MLELSQEQLMVVLKVLNLQLRPTFTQGLTNMDRKVADDLAASIAWHIGK